MWIESTIIITAFSFISIKVWNYNSLFVIISSISLFLILERIKINRYKILSYLSSFALSTYLIHQNQFITKFIYNDIFKSHYYSRTNLLLLNLLVTTISIFMVCAIIEIMRRFIFKYTVDKILEKSKVYNKVIEIEN